MKTLIKSVLLGTALIISVAFTSAFDFQMPDEDPPADSPKKVPKKAAKKKVAKKATKTKSKAVKRAKHIKRVAKKKAATVARRPEFSGVQEQIRLLHEKIDRLDTGHGLSTTPTSASSGHARDRPGYIPVPGTNTAIKIGGYIKADGIYDANQFTGDSSNLPNLRLKGLDADALRTNVFSAHAKQTRISIGSETQTAHGQVFAYFEGDFFGNSIEGTTGSFSRTDTSSLNSYNFRVRHAYGSYCFDNTHRVDIGQMWTLFYDPRSAGTTIEFNGPEITPQIRHPQIRYSHTYDAWKLSASVESGATEYLDVSPAFVGTPAGLTAGSPSTTFNTSQYRRANNSFLGGISGDGNQALPDFVVQVAYEKKKMGHFTLGGLVRELRIKKVTTTGPNDPTFAGKKYGYGVATGARYFIHDKSNIFGQFNFGKGIGTYIFAFDGYGAAMNASRGLMQTQFVYGFLVGGEHYWSDTWRTNLIYSQGRAIVSDIVPSGRTNVIGVDGLGNLVTIATTGYSVTNMVRQLYINLLWAPVEKFEVGIEYAYFQRNTINNYKGYGNRFQFGAYYKF